MQLLRRCAWKAAIFLSFNQDVIKKNRDQNFSIRRSKQKSLEWCLCSISEFLSVFLGNVPIGDASVSEEQVNYGLRLWPLT